MVRFIISKLFNGEQNKLSVKLICPRVIPEDGAIEIISFQEWDVDVTDVLQSFLRSF